MTKKEILQIISELFRSAPGNEIPPEIGTGENNAAMYIYDAPLTGIGAASDKLFSEYKKPEAIGPWFMGPEEWLPGARSVISIFFPFTKEVRRSNAAEKEHASLPWAYARVEGQQFIDAFADSLAGKLAEKGFRSCIPQADPRWERIAAGKGITGYPEITENTFGSRWSERHAAYVCGLGTFGLSKGLITERGMAGRFASLITDVPLEADVRPYTEIYEYCIHCNACVKRCPVNAIDPVTGKNHLPCSICVGKSKEYFYPRYGCGLCQTGVPCESRNPRSVSPATHSSGE